MLEESAAVLKLVFVLGFFCGCNGFCTFTGGFVVVLNLVPAPEGFEAVLVLVNVLEDFEAVLGLVHVLENFEAALGLVHALEDFV